MTFRSTVPARDAPEAGGRLRALWSSKQGRLAQVSRGVPLAPPLVLAPQRNTSSYFTSMYFRSSWSCLTYSATNALVSAAFL